MILVTGGTGFVGRTLVKQLVDMDYPVRIILRPSWRSPEIPRGIPLEVAISSLNDERGLRAAMVGVNTVYHLAGVEQRGVYGDLMAVDIRGTRAVVNAALDAGVDRIFYLSHIGADRSSAYPVAKAKAIAEQYIRKSGLNYTIFRSAIVYGPTDGFTTSLARLLYALPFIFLIPGDGRSLLQPLWIEDLVTCLVWALDDVRTYNETYELGGPEQLTLKQIMTIIMETLGIHRRLVSVRSSYLRALTVFLEAIFPGLPISVFWLDYLATNHTCALDTLPRVFNLLPDRMSHQLGYLQATNWRVSLFKTMFRRK
jgi:NADH dehydrogenase